VRTPAIKIGKLIFWTWKHSKKYLLSRLTRPPTTHKMASELKRKRGPVDVLDMQKRSKSFNTKDRNLQSKSQREPQLEATTLEAVLNPLSNTKELVQTNGVNGDADAVTMKNEHASIKAVASGSLGQRKKRKQEDQGKQERQRTPQKALKNDSNIWRLSEPVAGRMINADPLFTEDEKYANPFISFP
jgi:NET1-associated nuclear protein 1 (U3 small nucleolar RNA-associated protein 17)